ncbi:T9SS type A sorting domain-containing protein [bacterium]|nr:T9SS type A sorting domain-containing protein [bacterium]
MIISSNITKLILPLAITILLMVPASLFAVDFYVATTGIDTIGYGLEEDQPYRSVTFALFVADTTANRPHTIYIESGRYTEFTETYPLPMIDQTSLIGAGADQTILDATNSLSNVIFADFANDWSVENLTITGGVAIEGGGISAYQGSDGMLRNLIIEGNRADFPLFPNTQGEGGGVLIYEVDDMTVQNVMIRNNSAYDDGGALAIVRCSPLITNCTIVANWADQNGASGAVYYDGSNGDNPILENNIIWGNPDEADPRTSITATGNGTLTVRFSLVETDNGQPYTGTGNVFANPLFEIAGEDYHVLMGSQSVDRGNPLSQFNNEPFPNGGRVNAGWYGNTEDAQYSGAIRALRRDQFTLIGVPVNVPNGDPALLFQDDFGGAQPGDNSWRLQRWDNDYDGLVRFGEPERDGSEQGDPPAVVPGRGFILSQNQNNRTNVHVPGYALNQYQTFNYALETAGQDTLYQMIANPYPYPIDVMDTRFQTSLGLVDIDQAAEGGLMNRWFYSLDGTGRFVPHLGRLQPWEGVVVVTMDPSVTQWQVEPGRNEFNGGNVFDRLTWGLYAGVTAYNDSAQIVGSDAGHYFGIGEEMSNGLDVYDAVSLPWLRPEISFEWKSPAHPPLYHSFLSDSPGGDWRIWYMDFWVRTLNDTITADSAVFSIEGIISEEGEEPFPPAEYDLWLTDAWEEMLIPDLRDTSSIRLPLEDFGNQGRRLRVMIWCSRDDWEEVSVDVNPLEIPGKFEIAGVYPNPFNATTTISFTLPQQRNVMLSVYDILGRQVAYHDLGVIKQGLHRTVWNAGQYASGNYFIRMQAGEDQTMRRVMLVK